MSMPQPVDVGSRSEYSFDLLAPRHQSPTPSSATPVANYHHQITSGRSSRRNSAISTIGVNKRQSLQAADIYGYETMAITEYDNLAQRRPGDRSSLLVGNGLNAQDQYIGGISSQRGQYQEETNQYKDSTASLARDRAARDSPVIAELRTNVIVKDEFTLVTDLSYNLVKRYNRPASAIMVKLDHSACLALGGTFDPCYILTITAVSSHMGPTMNKRNAALIQSFMADILSVPPNRGIIKFHQMPEENLAINGTTILGELERQEKHLPADMRRALNSSMKRRSVVSLHQATSPKNDLDFNLGPLPQEPRNGAAMPPTDSSWNAAPTTTTPFQRSASDLNPQRPSTSHADSNANKPDFSLINLRSNSMRNEIGAAYGRLKSGRPKTFSGQDFEMLTTASTSTVPQLPTLNTATVPLSRKDRALSFLRSDPKASTTSTLSGGRKIVHPQSSFQSTSSSSRHDSYLDSPAVTSATNGAPSQLTTIADLKSGAAAAQQPSASLAGTGKTVSSNISSKRRSSAVNATPKIPVPPAIPVDAVSVKSQRLGKRKSFLAGFRRSAAPNTAAAQGRE
jgi:hypothetical protein